KLLGAEVVIGVTERHARFLRDGSHGGFVVPALAKHVEGSFEDQRFSLIAFDRLSGLLFVFSSHRGVSCWVRLKFEHVQLRAGYASARRVSRTFLNAFK